MNDLENVELAASNMYWSSFNFSSTSDSSAWGNNKLRA